MQEIQKKALVIDNGTGNIKVGFQGEDQPQISYQSFIGHPKKNDLKSTIEYYGQDVLSHENNAVIKYPMQHGIITNWEDMEKIFNNCFHKELQLNMAEYPCLITENTLNNKQNRQTLTEFFFETYKVPNFYIISPAVLTIYSLGKKTGIVLDSGEGVTQVTPIYQGYIIPHAITRVEIGGKEVTENLTRNLYEIGLRLQSSYEFEVARQLKEQICYVAQNYEAEIQDYEQNKSEPQEIEMPDGQKFEIKDQAFRSTEILFQSTLIGREYFGVHEMMLNSIKKCNEDVRGVFYKKIILTGGNTMFKGFQERINTEIINKLPNTIQSINIIKPPDPMNSAWLGGSVLTNLSTFNEMWISKEEYDEAGASIVLRKCNI